MRPIWRDVQKENFTKLDSLIEFLELSEEARKQILISPHFPLNLPKRLADKIEKGTLDDPIFRQFVPLVDEKIGAPGFVKEPVQDQTFRKTDKLLQKYHGRALLVACSACAMNCRFCFRQNFPYETERQGFDEEIAYLREHKDISEIILSGGDPLSLSDAVLAKLFEAIEGMAHIQRIRFHTRFPIGIPERIDDSFLSLLAGCSKQIVFIIHCNHAKEFDSDVEKALKKIQKLGIPLLNQSVLLKGVNDDEKTLLALCETLINAGVIPYYLHQLDRVEGTSHFEVSEEKATRLVQFVQENLSGFGVPRLVREVPGKPSKTFT